MNGNDEMRSPLMDFLNEEPFTDVDRAVLRHRASWYAGDVTRDQNDLAARIKHKREKQADVEREMVAAAVSLFSARVAQRQSESQDRHAKAMRGLTWALALVAVLQACVGACGVLAAFGEALAAWLK